MLYSIINLFKSKEKSKDVVNNRLRMILIHDRANMSKEAMASLRDEIIQVISKYMDINKNEMELFLESEDNSVALVANIPVRRLRHQ